MASPAIQNDEFACTLASIILMDDDVPITSEKLTTMLKAANVSVEPYWPSLFAKACSGLDLKSMVMSIGSSVGSGGSAPAASGAAAPAAAEEAPAAAKKEESEEESDDDMGFGLFD